MGSGCKGNISSKQACAQVFSTDCGIWQGTAVPILGICCGDTITEVETAIIEKLLTVLDGTGIDLSAVNLNNAIYLKQLLGTKDKNLLNFIQILVDSDTDLRSLIDEINTKLNQTDPTFTFDLKCLVDECCPPNLNRDQILQLVIDKLCEHDTIIKELQNNSSGVGDTINNIIGNFIGDSISTCSGTGIKKTGTGKDVKVTIVGIAPPGSYIPYFGPLDIFDASGKGMDGTSACGWYIGNGLNNTVDMRGYTFAGCTQGVGGGSLDARVDPNVQNQPSLATSIKDARGEAFHKLTNAESPSHTHSVNDPGHAHTYQGRAGISDNADDRGVMESNGNQTATVAKTGVTIGTSGGDQPHNNIQPTKYGVWITRFD